MRRWRRCGRWGERGATTTGDGRSVDSQILSPERVIDSSPALHPHQQGGAEPAASRRTDRYILCMSRHEKLLSQILRGASDANVSFEALRSLLRALGFLERIRGSHHLYTRDGVAEILNLQPRGTLAKPYQVKQVRQVIVKYKLTGGEE
jgi:hypothetical protein